MEICKVEPCCCGSISPEVSDTHSALKQVPANTWLACNLNRLNMFPFYVHILSRYHEKPTTTGADAPAYN